MESKSIEPGLDRSTLKRAYECRCERAIFFRNSHCLGCQTALGYDPHLGRVLSIVPGPQTDIWQLADSPLSQPILYRRCANLNTPAGCNWLVEIEPAKPVQQFCISCRLNRFIPDLSVIENQILWRRLEDAKRRVISSLVALGLPVASRVNEDPVRGLAFDFLRSPPGGPRVVTGHENGLITVDIEEADDVRREQVRQAMHEPYRTLVGHFRHEVGHYYWDRLVANSVSLKSFRQLFGDERIGYAAALRNYYQARPNPYWAGSYLSAYASVHPWEDWAETWAHYMHMVDTLGTAMGFGLSPEAVDLPFEHFSEDALYEPGRPDSGRFLAFLNAWLKLTAVLNELSRSMGQQDFYPFALPRAAVSKLHFVHTVVGSAALT